MNVGVCPDPFLSVQGSGSETSGVLDECVLCICDLCTCLLLPVCFVLHFTSILLCWQVTVVVSDLWPSIWLNRELYTPIMLGCMFALERRFFFEIGTFDEQMEIWGAENFEISFRVCPILAVATCDVIVCDVIVCGIVCDVMWCPCVWYCVILCVVLCDVIVCDVAAVVAFDTIVGKLHCEDILQDVLWPGCWVP